MQLGSVGPRAGSERRARAGVAIAVLGGLACGRGPFFAREHAIDRCAGGACTATIVLQRAVDLLFVIDNSGSMAAEQAKLSRNLPALLEMLDRERFGASYRIGITTTDSGGRLRLSSCRERLGEFDGVGENEDESYAGCLDNCAHEVIATVPTTTADDPVPAPRPWIEKIGERTNLEGGISAADAIGCAGPQGLNGWGHEAPLESMHDVLLGEGNAAGFLRAEALLAIVFITDETDCSMPSHHASLITREGATALWEVGEDGPQPSSAMCWNAGTACTGGPGRYDECHAVDLRFSGTPVEPGEDPVLYPVDRYVDGLRDIAAAKTAAGASGQIVVAAIGGVPLDYPETGQMLFEDSSDPEFNFEYGIGPGCDRGTETVHDPPGIPPVRMAELAAHFAGDERNLFSICADDYTPALEQLAVALGRASMRSCLPGCVRDHDDDEPGLQPDCRVVVRAPDERERVVPRCASAPGGWTFPAASPQICYRALVDAGGETAAVLDDLSPSCAVHGANLEIVVERPPTTDERAGTEVEIRCELVGLVGESCDEVAPEPLD